ncbi:hypothetical protein LguiA_013196 [Lonicera macranthoides]
MTYLENQIPEPPLHLEETWTRTLDPSGLAGFSILGLVRPRGETEALYRRYDMDCYVVDVSDILNPPSRTASVINRVLEVKISERDSGRHIPNDVLTDILLRLPTVECIFLWNPPPRKYWKSAVCKIPLGVEFIVFGFGYDNAKDDYKVVRMVQFYGYDEESFWSEVNVYSLKSDSWRRIEDFPYYISYERVSGVLASGALHWVVSRKRRSWGHNSSADLIASFDIRSEEYRLVPQTKYLIKNFDMTVQFNLYLDDVQCIALDMSDLDNILCIA